ncbi:MAG: DUF4493 domain-containing protein [Parabacteroides sp.]|nr:DUF4493 domain-containing protein [Parabacteroides sp.]
MYLLFKHIHLWLSLLLLLPACVQEELQQVPGKGEGILRLGNPTVIATLSSDKDTKATASLPDGIGTPDASAFQIDIYNEAGTELVKGDVNTTDEYVLATGKYRIKVTPTTASNPALITTTAPAYFEGSTIVEVKPLQVNTASVMVYWGYSILNVSVTDDLAFHLKTCSLEVKVGTETQTYAMKSDKTFETLYLLGGREAMVTLKGTNYMNESVSAVLLPNQELPRATSYAITANPDDIKKFDIISAVEAVHTYNSGTLTGTDVTLTIANDIPKELISNWSATLTFNDVTIRTYRSENSLNGVDKVTMGGRENMLYIPQNTTDGYACKLSYSYVMNGQTYNGEKDFDVRVPAPEFSVAVSAYTSYSKYLAGDISGANGCDPETIYDMKATPTISSEVLNANGSTCTLTLDGNTVSAGNATSQSWAAHTLAASYFFDGVTAQDSKTYHITGLPFRSNPPTEGHWKGSGTVNWESSYVRLGNLSWSQPHNITSNSFNVPGNMNVNISTKYQVKSGGVGTTFTLILGENQLFYKKIGNYEDETIEDTANSIITTSNNYIKCNNSYGSGNTHSKVYYVNVLYR